MNTAFTRTLENFYWAFPKGLEMLFLYAFAFGKHSAAALVHFAFLIALAAAIILYARRHDQLLAGVFASLLVFLSPAVALDGTTAYADVALAAATFGSFWASTCGSKPARQRLLFWPRTFAGFSFTIKYTGLLAVAYVFVVILLARVRLYCRAARVYCLPACISSAIGWSSAIRYRHF